MNTLPCVVQLPFSGFYESIWTSEVNNRIEQDAEWLEEHDDRFKGMELSEITDAICDQVDFRNAYAAIARGYAIHYGEWVRIELGLSVSEFGWEFDSLDSPREYNFRTDELFVRTTPEVIERIFSQTSPDKLEKEIKAYNTCIKVYYRDTYKYTEVSAANWDSQQLHVLLWAWMKSIDDAPYERELHLMYDMSNVISEYMEYDLDKVLESLKEPAT